MEYLSLMNEIATAMTTSAWFPTDREMLVEVLEFYIHHLKQDNCNQAAIDAHEELLDRLERGEPIDLPPWPLT